MILHNKAEPTDKLESSFPAFKFHGLSHLILSSFPIRNQDDQFGFLWDFQAPKNRPEKEEGKEVAPQSMKWTLEVLNETQNVIADSPPKILSALCHLEFKIL